MFLLRCEGVFPTFARLVCLQHKYGTCYVSRKNNKPQFALPINGQTPATDAHTAYVTLIPSCNWTGIRLQTVYSEHNNPSDRIWHKLLQTSTPASYKYAGQVVLANPHNHIHHRTFIILSQQSERKSEVWPIVWVSLIKDFYLRLRSLK